MFKKSLFGLLQQRFPFQKNKHFTTLYIVHRSSLVLKSVEVNFRSPNIKFGE